MTYRGLPGFSQPANLVLDFESESFGHPCPLKYATVSVGPNPCPQGALCPGRKSDTNISITLT